VTASTATLGKPAGSDLRAGKSTYPGLLGLDAARAYAESLLESALRLHDALTLKNTLLADLAVRSVRRAF
ncbi:MAG: geranyl transferase, partial [Pseudomonadales bacterium]